MKVKPVREPLLPVQEEALVRAEGRRGFGWFMDMGLGKTRTALEEFDRMLAKGMVKRMVVIVPNSFKSGWGREIMKAHYYFNYHVYESSRHRRAADWLKHGFKQPPVLIINYEAVRTHKGIDFVEAFAGKKPTFLVVDESINIKSNTAKQTRAVLGIGPLFTVVRILTGRPMTQGPHDLWGQLRLIGAYDRSYYAFRNRFCQMGGWQNRQVIGAQNTEELARIMEPWTFQATKQEWLPTLPEKLPPMERTYDLGPILRPRYIEMERTFILWLEANRNVSVDVVIAQYQKLLQIQCGFIHDANQATHWLVSDDHNPRLQALLTILEEVTGKVCITYSHRVVGDQLVRTLPASINIRGGMRPEDLQGEVDRFNRDPAVRYAILQIDAAKYGLTLLGDQSSNEDACRMMVFYQSSYSFDTRAQVTDRIHRIGQDRACSYLDIVGTQMDRHMLDAVIHKRNMYDAVMTAPRGA